MTVPRIYDPLLAEHLASNRQTAFFSGPRQVGKTTPCWLRADACVNRDDIDDRELILAGPRNLIGRLGLGRLSETAPVVLIDELHKFPRWKQFLRGFFDTHADRIRIAVTGSSRMVVYRSGCARHAPRCRHERSGVVKSHGLTTGAPAAWKPLMSRVAMARHCAACAPARRMIPAQNVVVCGAHTPTHGGRYVPIAILPHPRLGESHARAKAMVHAFGSGRIKRTDTGFYVADSILCVEAARTGAPAAFTFETGESGRLEEGSSTTARSTCAT